VRADARRGVEVRYQKDSALMPGDNLVLNVAFTGNRTGSAAGHGAGGDEQTQLLERVSYRFWSDGPSNASIGFSNSNISTAAPRAAAVQRRSVSAIVRKSASTARV